MKKIYGVLALALFVLISQAHAFQSGCEMDDGRHPHIFSALELTEDQRQQLQSRREAFVAEISPLRNELFTRREELRQLWARSARNPEQVQAKQREILQLQGQIQEKAAEFRIECRQALTPEQQAKLTNITAEGGGWKSGSR